MPDLERKPGTYALILHARHDRRIRVGRLGTLDIRPGFYIYVGSAFGPGGVAARVAHHRKRGRRLHWHIDYLTRAVTLEEIWYCYDPTSREHQWAAALAEARGATVPMPGFGASDCRCSSHLIYYRRWPSLRRFRRWLCADVVVAACRAGDVPLGNRRR